MAGWRGFSGASREVTCSRRGFAIAAALGATALVPSTPLEPPVQGDPTGVPTVPPDDHSEPMPIHGFEEMGRPIPPGRYRFQQFRPPITLAVGDGWEGTADFPDVFELRYWTFDDDRGEMIAYVAGARLQVAYQGACPDDPTQIAGARPNYIPPMDTRARRSSVERSAPGQRRGLPRHSPGCVGGDFRGTLR